LSADAAARFRLRVGSIVDSSSESDGVVNFEIGRDVTVESAERSSGVIDGRFSLETPRRFALSVASIIASGTESDGQSEWEIGADVAAFAESDVSGAFESASGVESDLESDLVDDEFHVGFGRRAEDESARKGEFVALGELTSDARLRIGPSRGIDSESDGSMGLDSEGEVETDSPQQVECDGQTILPGTSRPRFGFGTGSILESPAASEGSLGLQIQGRVVFEGRSRSAVENRVVLALDDTSLSPFGFDSFTETDNNSSEAPEPEIRARLDACAVSAISGATDSGSDET
jgi:hypothetical protein